MRGSFAQEYLNVKSALEDMKPQDHLIPLPAVGRPSEWLDKIRGTKKGEVTLKLSAV